MVKNWEEIKNAIKNLKEVKKTKTKNINNLPVGALLNIDGKYYIVEEKNIYKDWSEYKLKNILNNKKSYLEVEEDRISLWERVSKNEEVDILEKFYKGMCSLIESGDTGEYKYYTIRCDGKLYSIEEYSTGDTKEREVYKSSEVRELKLL
ncbi:MAG: hypothetical protein DSY60_01020 [Persephonella sp.]|nr:MAG: hypothetical protein DSY60_01020 [Persephonella sp.]